MKLTFYSNGIVGTGYGTQVKQMVPRLQRDGWKVALAANYGINGQVVEHPGLPGGSAFPILPGGIDQYSNDIVAAHHAAWTRGEPGGILALYDAWPLRVEEFTKEGTQVAMWAPVDHLGLPSGCRPFLIHPDVLPIAMSRFGQEQMRAAGIDARYAPHGIDRTVHKPGQKLRDRDPRDALGIPADAFLVTMNAANKGQYPPRKAWGENLQALSLFLKAHPDAWAYIHTMRQGVGGVDIAQLAAAVGLPAERVRWADAYAYLSGLINDTDVAAIHGSADVHLAVSMGEGFGLSVAESLAAAVPSIVSSFSAQPEIVGDTGWLVEGQLFWDALQGSWFFTPFVHSILDKLEAAYAERGTAAAAARREACLDRSTQYDADVVFETHWRPILTEFRDRITAKALKVAAKPVNTAIRPNPKKRRKAA